MGTSQLVARARAGDEAALGQLYSRYYDRIVRCAETSTHNRHDAEDIAQQVAIQLMNALSFCPEATEDFENWLFSIVRYRTIDHARRQEHLQFEAPELIARREEAEPPRAPRHNGRWRFDEELGRLLQLLPERQRQVVLLRYLFDLSASGVAAALRCSVNCVHQNEHRALTRLASRLTHDRKRLVSDLLSDPLGL